MMGGHGRIAPSPLDPRLIQLLMLLKTALKSDILQRKQSDKS